MDNACRIAGSVGKRNLTGAGRRREIDQYLLIEFQSTVDLWMAVRMMTYVGLLYQDLIRRGEVLEARKLPPVLPIVLYNGDAKWTAATDIAVCANVGANLFAHGVP